MIVPAAAVRYVELQRTECRGGDVRANYARVMAAEFEVLAPYLPDTCRAFVDIGCGVGGMAALVAAHYGRVDAHLLDRTECPPKPWYGFRPRAAFYNSLTVAQELVALNAPRAVVHAWTASSSNRIPLVDGSVDLIYSLLAIGFHAPWDLYRGEILRTLSPDGVLILDLRRGTGQLAEVQTAFSLVEVIGGSVKAERICAMR